MRISATDIITRLKSALKISTDADFARLINKNPSVITTWKERNSIDHNLVIDLCEKNNLDLNEFFIRKTQTKNVLAEPLEAYGNISNSLPLISIDAFAGFEPGNLQITGELGRYLVPEFQNKADFLVRISGTSMSPKYYNGDVVACKKIPKKTFIQWGKVYVMDTIQGVLCKRIVKSKNESCIICRSDNAKMYPEFEINWEDVRELAIVIGVIRLE